MVDIFLVKLEELFLPLGELSIDLLQTVLLKPLLTYPQLFTDGEDLDILPGVPADILPGGLREEELYKIFGRLPVECVGFPRIVYTI